jgi:ribosome maturation factor RimP
MIDIEKIKEFVNECLGNGELFLIDATCSPDNDIEITIDSDSQVDIDDCIALNDKILSAFDRDQEDYSLTVTSAGLGQPLQTLRQYLKFIGQKVEVLTSESKKLNGVLISANENQIVVSVKERVTVEGKKRKQTVDTELTLELANTKWVKPVIEF